MTNKKKLVYTFIALTVYKMINTFSLFSKNDIKRPHFCSAIWSLQY